MCTWTTAPPFCNPHPATIPTYLLLPSPLRDHASSGLKGLLSGTLRPATGHLSSSLLPCAPFSFGLAPFWGCGDCWRRTRGADVLRCRFGSFRYGIDSWRGDVSCHSTTGSPPALLWGSWGTTVGVRTGWKPRGDRHTDAGFSWGTTCCTEIQIR